MTCHGRRATLASLAGLLAVGLAGCDPGSAMYFLMPEPREDALLKDLGTPKSQKKENRVAILIYPGVMDLKIEFLHADRQLSELLARQIEAQCKENGEAVEMLPRRTVENFKNNHPDWKQMDLAEVGRLLKVDYLIYLELNSLSLHEQGSMRQLFRGRANISVNLVDINHPDDSRDSDIFTCTYPSEAHQGTSVDMDTPPEAFRHKFFECVAKKLSRYFSRYPKRETSMDE